VARLIGRRDFRVMPHFVQGDYKFEVGKILCVRSSGDGKGPIIFLKPPSSILHEGESILMGNGCYNLGHDLYLCAAVGKKIVKDTKSKLGHILGFGLMMDVFDREELSRCREGGLPWLFANGRDTFCPISEFVESDSIHDPYGLEVYLEVNDEEKLSTNTKELVLGLEDAFESMTEFMTLSPGDLLGVRILKTEGTLYPGDRVEAGLSSVGVLRNDVAGP
jgi:2-keto-4-pentenoate hydratase/2-oxohepta-3-ene-1,7-dioic acid hydratase in catechol pathway